MEKVIQEGQALSIPREQSREYMIALNAFFSAAKEFHARAEMLVPPATGARFDLWLVELETACHLWVKQAQNGEAIGEPFGEFLGLMQPPSANIALEFIEATGMGARE
jgi:hypothetical protein